MVFSPLFVGTLFSDVPVQEQNSQCKVSSITSNDNMGNHQTNQRGRRGRDIWEV